MPKRKIKAHPQNMVAASLINTQRILEQIRGLLDDLVGLETEEDDEEKSIPNLQALDLSYVKSLRIEIPENRLAAKYVGKNVIAHPVFIWGDATKTDLEADFFTKETDFWDKSLAGFARPLTWDHGQDKKFAQFEDNPVIGKTVKYFDDDLARWALLLIFLTCFFVLIPIFRKSLLALLTFRVKAIFPTIATAKFCFWFFYLAPRTAFSSIPGRRIGNITRFVILVPLAHNW